MIRKYIGDKKSIEARSNDGGMIWEGKLFERGHVTKFSDASLAEVNDLAAKKGMRLDSKLP